MWITQLSHCKHTTPAFTRRLSPEGATSIDSSHLIAANYSFIDSERMCCISIQFASNYTPNVVTDEKHNGEQYELRCVVLLYRKEANMMTLRSRYSCMYIPSDFFHAAMLWLDAFPVDRPFRLGHSCQFHVMDKKVEAPERKLLESLLDPPDADHTFSAKVSVVLSFFPSHPFPSLTCLVLNRIVKFVLFICSSLLARLCIR